MQSLTLWWILDQRPVARDPPTLQEGALQSAARGATLDTDTAAAAAGRARSTSQQGFPRPGLRPARARRAQATHIT
jgi:hypothetical protein